MQSRRPGNPTWMFRADLCQGDTDAWVRHGSLLAVVAGGSTVGVRRAAGAASDEDLVRVAHDFGLGAPIEAERVGLCRILISPEAAGIIFAGVVP